MVLTHKANQFEERTAPTGRIFWCKSSVRKGMFNPKHMIMENTMSIGSVTDRKQNNTVWLAQGFLSVVFLVTGVMKLTMSMESLTAMMTWPGKMPLEFVRLIGLAEVLGALGLVLPMLTGIRPILTSYAAFGLMVLMIGALGYHLMLFQGSMLLPSAVLGTLAAYVGVRRMPEIRD